MKELTIKDRKLLYYLSLNSRESHTKIAKKVGLSKGAVGYKIRTFLEKGIIKNFSAVINTGALDATSFSMLIKLNKPLEKSPEIKNYFISHPNSLWVMSLSGTYDLFIEFITFSFRHMNNLVKEIKEELGETLNHYELHLLEETLKVEHLIEDIYKGLDLQKPGLKTREFKEKKLDSLDKQILCVLAQNSEMSLTDLAFKVKSKWDIVRYRIKQMEDAGVLLGYFPEIDYSKLGYSRFICKLELINLTLPVFKELKTKIKYHGSITYAFVNTNSVSILFDIQVKELGEIDLFLGELQERFKNQIKNIDYYIVREQLKFNLFPEGLLANSTNMTQKL